MKFLPCRRSGGFGTLKVPTRICFCLLVLARLAASWRWDLSHQSRIDITSIGGCVPARSQHRGIYDTHDTTTAPHTARPFDAVEGATALLVTRFYFMWTCVSADSPSSAPLLSPYFPFFHCRGSDFVTGFEEPDSALLPSSGSSWSSSTYYFKNEIKPVFPFPIFMMPNAKCFSFS